MAEDNKIGIELIRRFEKIEGDRTILDSNLNEVATFVIPRKAEFFRLNTVSPGGEKRTYLVFDSTAIFANNVFAAGLYSNLCPMGQRWFRLEAEEPEFNEDEEVKTWMEETTNRLHAVFNASNFGMAVHECLCDYSSLGTIGMLIEDTQDAFNPISFLSQCITNFWITEDENGNPNTVFRKWILTAEQAVAKYGAGVTEEVAACAKDPNRMDNKFEFIHVITPRKVIDKNKLDAKNKPIASIVIDRKTKHIVSESGYDEYPFPVARYSKSTNELYGRSPGMDMLADIKMLNRMERTIITAGEKTVDPPMAVEDGATVGPVRPEPGGVTYIFPGKEPPKPLNSGARVDIGLEMTNQKREQIKTAFFVDLWFALSDKPSNMTATEVLERVNEKIMIIGPVIGRLLFEWFPKIIERCLGILSRAGKLPKLPEILNGKKYSVKFISRFALAMRQNDIKAFSMSLNSLTPLMAVGPEAAQTVLDEINVSDVTRGIFEANGTPLTWLNTTEEKEMIQQSRAQAAQTQQAMDMAETAGKVVPKMGKKIEEGSPMSELMGAE
jgi:hypothetical protein